MNLIKKLNKIVDEANSNKTEDSIENDYMKFLKFIGQTADLGESTHPALSGDERVDTYLVKFRPLLKDMAEAVKGKDVKTATATADLMLKNSGQLADLVKDLK